MPERSPSSLGGGPALNERLPLEVTLGDGRSFVGTIGTLHVGQALSVVPGTGAALDVLPGTPASVRYTRPNDSAYRFTTVVRHVDADGTMWLEHPRSIQRMQARAHARVAIELDVLVAPAGPRRLAGGPSGWRGGMTVDLSGRGLALRSAATFVPGTTALIDLAVPERRGHLRLQERTEVVRVAGDLVGMRLVDLASGIEDRLVAAVFHLMAAQRRGDEPGGLDQPVVDHSDR